MEYMATAACGVGNTGSGNSPDMLFPPDSNGITPFFDATLPVSALFTAPLRASTGGAVAWTNGSAIPGGIASASLQAFTSTAMLYRPTGCAITNIATFLVNVQGVGFTGSYYWKFSVYINNSTTLCISVGNAAQNSFSPNCSLTTPSEILYDKWHHYAFVYDGSSTGSWYINGVLVGTMNLGAINFAITTPAWAFEC